VSLFGNALGVVISRIHSAQGAPVVVYTCAGQAPVTIDAVFDAAHQAVDLATGELSDLGPVLGIRVSDLPVAPEQDDTLTINGVAYAVSDVQVDGQGGATLPLRKVI
jgi:hypothetical protein